MAETAGKRGAAAAPAALRRHRGADTWPWGEGGPHGGLQEEVCPHRGFEGQTGVRRAKCGEGLPDRGGCVSKAKVTPGHVGAPGSREAAACRCSLWQSPSGLRGRRDSRPGRLEPPGGQGRVLDTVGTWGPASLAGSARRSALPAGPRGSAGGRSGQAPGAMSSPRPAPRPRRSPAAHLPGPRGAHVHATVAPGRCPPRALPLHTGLRGLLTESPSSKCIYS